MLTDSKLQENATKNDKIEEKLFEAQKSQSLYQTCSLKCGFQNFGFEVENQDQSNDGKFDTNLKSIEGKIESRNKPSIWLQILCAFCGALPSIVIGASYAITGVILPQLTSPDDINMNQTETALFVSLLSFGSMIGCATNGILTTWLGQRKTLLMVIPVTVATSILLYLSHSILILLILRTVIGTLCGILSIAAMTYVVELSHKGSRGLLSSLIDMFQQIGMVAVQLVGSTNLNWRETTIICCVPPLILSFIGLLFLPNSPRWLATKLKFDEAFEALKFFRGTDYNCEEEFSEIKSEASQYKDKNNIKNQFRYLKDRLVLKRFLLIAVLMVAIQFSGGISILSYTIAIFKEVQVGMNEYLSVVIVGSAGIFGNLLYSSVADRYERKRVFNISMLISSLCLFLLGTFYFVKIYLPITTAFSWIHLFSLVVFRMSFCICNPILHLLCNELLPSRVRLLGSSLLKLIFFFGGFFAVFSFPYLTKIFKFYGVFWFYATVCVLMLMISIKWLPETKGCSLEDIEAKFTSS